MLVRRILFLGERKREVICSRIEDAVSRWMDNWSFQSNTNVKVEFFSNFQRMENGECFQVNGNKFRPYLWVECEIEDLINIIWPDGFPQFPADKIAQELVQDAYSSLISMVLQNILGGQSVSHDRSEKRISDIDEKYPGDNLVGFSIFIDGKKIDMMLEVNEWLSLYGSSKNGIGLFGGDQVLLKQKVGLQVELELGNFSIRTLAGLSKGDVLVSEVPLESKFDVSIGENGLVKAYLGKKGDKKAVQTLAR